MYFPRREVDDVSIVDIDITVAQYPVFVGGAPQHQFAEYLRTATQARRVAIIADENTSALFGIRYETALITAGFDVVPVTIQAGETSKSWEVAGQLLEGLAGAHLERSDMILALGGGVISDLAGFVASIYLRGVDYALVSTSLLSLVDAAVGGKTGVDLVAGKNLAGSFKQPLAIAADVACLASLPEDEFKSGLAEVAKTAFLDGPDFVAWCSENASAICARDFSVLTELVLRCIEFKALVVANDVEDHGPRECLNYGHTLGHALEKLSGYGKLTHGAAVAEGMRFAARVGVSEVGAPIDIVYLQDELLEAFGLEPLPVRFEVADVMEAMRSDKKVRNGDVRMVLLSALGEWVTTPVSDDVLFEHLRAWKDS